MKLLVWMVEQAFGCRHKKMSRVFTINKRTYQVCFDCGQEFDQSLAPTPTLHPDVAA